MATDAPGKARPRQSLHAAQIADALLRLQSVQDLSGLGKTSIYKAINAGELTPVRMGKRCTRFRAADVLAWLQAKAQ